MAQIAFLLLCHKDVPGIVAQARGLVAAGDRVAIHFDARAPRAEFDRLRAALAGEPAVAFAARRVRCGWGEWSLVEATRLAMAAALAAFPEATHLYMVSGDCLPIKSATHARRLLDAADADWIESVDFHEGGWIRTGLKEERLLYRHPFNERTQRGLFYASLALQARLGLTRQPPPDLRVMIGSQWWCLRRRTAEAIEAFLRARPDVVRFFRGTWIPDETFFQTLVRHLVPAAEIRSRPLTFLLFTDYGMPVTFHKDHHDLLMAQDHLFARKVSPEAGDLRTRLRALWASGRTDLRGGDEGRRVVEFLRGRGRVGRRFAPRAWEAAATLGPGRELLVVAAKKWHVAKRLLDAMGRHAGDPAVGFLFDEAEAGLDEGGLPDLGGIESSLAKRSRHRRAVLRMVFDRMGTDRLLMGLDAGALDVLQDLQADRGAVRLLEVECRMSDDYLAGHARRVGLAAVDAGDLAGLLPALRRDLAWEAERLRAARLPDHHRVVEAAPPDRNAAAIAAFLRASPEVARRIAATPHLFDD